MDLIIIGSATAIGGAILAGIFFVILRIYLVYKAIKEMLRNEIIKTYNEYNGGKKLNHYELETVNKFYDLYKLLGGNGYAETVIMKIKTGIKDKK